VRREKALDSAAGKTGNGFPRHRPDRRSAVPGDLNVLFTQPNEVVPLCFVHESSSRDREPIHILADQEDVLIGDVEAIDLGPRYFSGERSDSGGEFVRLN
jgi:hypothetical protein